MIVCVCRRVSDRDIERHARAGSGSFDEMQMDLGVATCCGRCSECARAVFDSAQVGTASALQSIHSASIRHTSA